jgi:hypothetical protein
MDWSWLLLLMCPLMMLPMMFMMFKGNHSGSGQHDHDKHMSEEMEKIKSENAAMQQELREIKKDLFKTIS